MTPEEFKTRMLPVKNKLFRLALSLLHNRQEAEDSVQEVYMKMWKMRNDLGKYKSIEALMMTITRNHCLDRLKAKKNRAITLNEEINSQSMSSPDIKTEQVDLIEMVKDFIRKLPEQQKTLVHLRDVEGYEFDEIVKITGYDLNYIRVNLSRGRSKIRESINKMHQYETGRS